MTHDELLAIIDVDALVNPKPLLEVVKLHKPFMVQEMMCCEGCSNSEFFPYQSCPTIKVIVEALA